MKYNKLVRDKIPEVIKSKGGKFIIHVADDDEYYKKLKEKLLEEVNEFLKNDNEEEVADILEVIYAILVSKNVNKEKIEEIRKKKADKRGGFEKKIILEEA